MRRTIEELGRETLRFEQQFGDELREDMVSKDGHLNVRYQALRGLLELADSTRRDIENPPTPEPTGKLPSERISEIAKAARGRKFGDGVTGEVIAYSVEADDVAQYLDERLGRAPGKAP